jgi:pilus assembly protein CpaC
MQKRPQASRRSPRLALARLPRWARLCAAVALACGVSAPLVAQSPCQALPPVKITPDSAPSVRVVSAEGRPLYKLVQPEPPRFPDKRVPDVRDLPKQPNQKDGSPGASPPTPAPAPGDVTQERRLPLLGAPRLGAAPKPTQATQEKYARFIADIIDPDNTLMLVVGRPRLLKLKAAPAKVQVADDKIADYGFLSDLELSIQGQAVGSTILNLWFADPADPKKEIILSYLLQVVPDTEAKQRLENVYKALEEEINRAFPDSHICLGLVGDKLAVSGQAKDIAEGTAILRIVRANAPGGEQPAARIPVDQVNVNVNAELDADAVASPALREFLLAGGPNVINLIRIPGEQQVMLKVVVAEVDRDAARSIGLNFSIASSVRTVFAQLTGGIGGVGTASPVNNLPAFLDNGQVSIAINALRTLNFARTYAEPSLTALNGRPASFQAGGQFPVPVVTGFTGAGLQGVQFVPFGVQLRFTPYITDKDRVRLVLSADVSEQTGQTTNVSNSQIPNLNTRNFQTTVELREGQTLAVAGLIQTDFRGLATRVPFFGDLPLIGRAFGFDATSGRENELVILITPKLVSGVDAKDVGPLPGSDVFEPGDIEFYLRGILESRRGYDYRAAARTDIDRMCAYRRCENLFIVGPFGNCEGPAASEASLPALTQPGSPLQPNLPAPAEQLPPPGVEIRSAPGDKPAAPPALPPEKPPLPTTDPPPPSIEPAQFAPGMTPATRPQILNQPFTPAAPRRTLFDAPQLGPPGPRRTLFSD